MSEPGECTMCEEEPATTRYGLPVCQSCHDWLTNTVAPALADMEAACPDCAGQGWTAEHAAGCDGACAETGCPVQEQCRRCAS